MKCSVCGSDNLDGSAYCEDCGARLPVGGAAPAASNPPPAPASPTPPASEEAEPTPEPSGEGGVLVCASCGAENPSYEAYCEDCGASLSGTSGAPVVSVSSESEPVAVAAPAVARIRLSLADGSREFPVSKDTIEIGRRSPVDGIYPDVDLTDVDTESFISRRHGRVLKGESGVLYEDLGSSNGSFLNDSRLQAGVQTALKDGDRLRLGKTEMVFRAS
ncbi:MAG: hypothetical protein AMXMBFR33_27460 [Candidatus Xenobia bacterium]